jgi:hypothetical protein
MRGAQRTDRKELVVAASHRTTLSSPRLAPTLCHIFGSPPPCDSTSCALRRLPLAQVLPLGPRPRFAPMEVQRSGNDGARSHRRPVASAAGRHHPDLAAPSSEAPSERDRAGEWPSSRPSLCLPVVAAAAAPSRSTLSNTGSVGTAIISILPLLFNWRSSFFRRMLDPWTTILPSR